MSKTKKKGRKLYDAPEKQEDMPLNKTKKKRQKLHEFSMEQDMHYRGPLSYRHFRILGWLCIALSQVVVILSIVPKISAEAGEQLITPITILKGVASLSLPFLLLASFAVVLNSNNEYKKQLRFYGLFAGIIIAAVELLFHRYILGGIGKLVEGGRAQASAIVEGAIQDSSFRYLTFNVFIDVVLCVLFMYFLNYKPEKKISSTKLKVFRAMAVLPVLYEIACFVFKYLAVNGRLMIPVSFWPFLTTKTPIMFLVFIILAAHIKTREKRFCKEGRTHREYLAFLKTNRNSWDFSVFTCIVLVIAAIVDFVLLYCVVKYYMGGAPLFSASTDSVLLHEAVNKAQALGFGKSVILAAFGPVMLLFSYTRVHKNSLIDLLIPVIGIVLILIVYLEGLYMGIGFLPDLLESLGSGV